MDLTQCLQKKCFQVANVTYPFSKTIDGSRNTFNYNVLNYRADAESLYLRVTVGEPVYLFLDAPPWENLEVFFPGPSPFPESYAMIRREDDWQNPYCLPLMGTVPASTIANNAGIFEFNMRLKLLETRGIENKIVSLDPQIIVDEGSG